MRYRLRTLLALLAICPPLLAGAWIKIEEYRRWLAQQELAHAAARPMLVTPTTSDYVVEIQWSASGPVADLDLAYSQGPTGDLDLAYSQGPLDESAFRGQPPRSAR